MNVLLAVDNSPLSDTVTKAVLAQRPAKETAVKVLQVLIPPPLLVSREMSGYDPEMERVLQAQREEAESNVASIADVLRSHGFDVSVDVEYGEIEAKILQVAGAWPADLIVLGSPEHGRLGAFLSRNISQSVAKHARCSVEIVRETSVRPEAYLHSVHPT